jgi:D-alanine-D-alanine ligase
LPLFVKPLRADASIGIDGGSLVRTATDLMKRVVQIHEELHDAALAEEYIEGREFYVGVLGNQDPVAFPPIELDFSGLDPDKPRIADSKAKWEKGSPEYQGTRSVLADVAPELLARLQKAALAAYRALRVRDYGRVDFRVTDTGEIYVIEVNASCYLERASEFATAARAAGIEYDELIGRIVQLALERHDKQLSRVSIT